MAEQERVGSDEPLGRSGSAAEAQQDEAPTFAEHVGRWVAVRADSVAASAATEEDLLAAHPEIIRGGFRWFKVTGKDEFRV